MSNIDLRRADKNKNDEFYTQLLDIEKELCHYKNDFKGKVIYCNCDNPYKSNFVKYFIKNFKSLNLKKLIATCYPDNYKLVVNAEDDIKKWESKVISIKNGDFRSEECVELLKEADIVITNPPFSLFREYVLQIIEHNKKFIIIGNVNAITYKEIFPLIKENKMWMGVSIHSGDREFMVPDDYPLEAANYRVDEFGQKYIRVKGVRWWTNLDYEKRHEILLLDKKYDSNIYPKYDNYDAINVNRTKDIPYDYCGVMGVPITFLDKYNPEQFELLGIMNTGEKNMGIRHQNAPHGRPLVNGKEMYLRILIRKVK